MKQKLAVFTALLGATCSREPATSEVEPIPAATNAPAIPDGVRWLLEGPTDERFVRVARQLRGFDVAMAETGYRYAEFHWAGRDRNWDYATYQLDKIDRDRQWCRAPAAAGGVGEDDRAPDRSPASGDRRARRPGLR